MLRGRGRSMYLTRALGINSIRRSSPISTLYKPIWWTTAAACAVRPLTAAVLRTYLYWCGGDRLLCALDLDGREVLTFGLLDLDLCGVHQVRLGKNEHPP